MRYILLIISVLTINSGFSQAFLYNTQGSAEFIESVKGANCSDGSCFQLTPAKGAQGGTVWSKEVIDLKLGFDFSFCVYLGAKDLGADGIAFVMHQGGINLPAKVGGSLGFNRMNPSVLIEIDTWDNEEAIAGDKIKGDHLALVYNSDFQNPKIGPVVAIEERANIEDNRYHDLRIVWNPNCNLLEVYFDGELRMANTDNIVTRVFKGNGVVNWGFTGATGLYVNRQMVCMGELKTGLDVQCGEEEEKIEPEVKPVIEKTPNIEEDEIFNKASVGSTIQLKDILFERARAKMRPSAFPVLYKLSKYMQENKNARIELSGHTDNNGGESENLALSKKRVEAVKHYLVRIGVEEERIETKHFGESKPLYDNDDAYERSKNRRVELKFLSK